MDRETKKKISVLQKSINAIVREIAKPYKYKVIDGQIWTIQNGFIFVFFPHIATPPEGASLDIRLSAKPLYIDDYLWDILGLPENKEAKTSLRINGAFSLFGIPFEKSRTALVTLDTEEVYAKLQTQLNAFRCFLASITGTETKWFETMEEAKSSYYHSELMRLILNLHKGNYAEVLKYVETHEVTGFVVDNKTIGEHIKEYCLLRL